MNSRVKNLAFWVMMFFLLVMMFHMFNTQEPIDYEEIIFSDFLTMVTNGEVGEVVIALDPTLAGMRNDGSKFRTYRPPEFPELVGMLREHNVRIIVKPPEETPWYMTFLMTWGPFVLFLVIWIFLMKQMQVGGNKALSFGKSKAKLVSEDKKKVTFEDVAGIEEAKDEVTEIIEFLKDPKKFQRLGGRIPKGVLIVGPPGTGKTLLAKAIAGEAGVPFFSISGSDFVEMFVGVGASRVRDLFEQGKKNAPCIIFIDEIDAVGRLRGAGIGGGHDEREQTLNQLLVEMDGFDTNEGVILIAATNRPDVLDPALMRPGRFDRQILVSRPDVAGRKAILSVHSKKVQLDNDVDLETIARGTPGLSGADIQNMVNEAALLASRNNKSSVGMEDFEFAKDKILMGVERKSLIISDDEKRNTAYHEAGHTLVARKLPGADPIHKVSIIPRGRALGVTVQLPEDDRYTYTSKDMTTRLAMLMGGRAAEEIALHHTTTGAGNDIERATGIARSMVCEWGMSEKLGPMTFGKKEEEVFLGREISQHRDYSEETARMIDLEVRNLVNDGYNRAKQILNENRDALTRLAETLLEKEGLDRVEVDAVIAGTYQGGKQSKKETKEKDDVTDDMTDDITAKDGPEQSDDTTKNSTDQKTEDSAESGEELS